MTYRLSFFSKCSILLGNLFEHYDTALFSLLSPFIAPLFFPGKDPLTALILTYCIIPLGMLARPIGSLFFGYIGDKKGRKEALMIALTGMTFVTVCMGLIPTYQQAGWLAPFLLSVCRLFQNFFAAGEIIGGAIYLIEHTSEKRKDMISSFYNASTVMGILLASLGVSVLGVYDLIYDYWRVLYFMGCFTALFAIVLRLKMALNLDHFESSPSSLNPIATVLKACWENRQNLLVIIIASGFSYASYTMTLVMMNGLVPLVTSISKLEMMHLNTLLLGIDFLLLPFFGFLATRYSREKMMVSAGLLAFITGIPLFWFVPQASLMTILLIRLIIVIGVWFAAPFHSWSQALIQPSQRYTVISFGYALGTQLLGGPTAALALWSFQQTGWVISAAWYWMILGCLTSYLIARQKTLQIPQPLNIS